MAYYNATCPPGALALLIRQLLRWRLAAKQDQDAGVRFLHASYGIATVDALRQVATDQQIRAVTGQDLTAVHAELTEIQDEAAQAVKQG